MFTNASFDSDTLPILLPAIPNKLCECVEWIEYKLCADGCVEWIEYKLYARECLEWIEYKLCAGECVEWIEYKVCACMCVCVEWIQIVSLWNR